jgi:CheY-like chemotaxis protein
MEGHVVCESVSAEGAAAAIAANSPDVILLDLRLPGMDGVALIRQLKSNPETRDIPTVAMTAYPEDYRREDLVAAGCDAYIVKPIDTRTLPRKLEELAGRQPGE